MPLRKPQAELIKAIRRNDVCKVKFLLEQGLDPNFVDQSYFQFSPLHYAARAGNQQICMLLVSIGAASLRGYTESGQTPLHCAAISGDLDTCQYLCGFEDCNLRALDDMDRTAVDIAWIMGHEAVVSYLENHPRSPSPVKNYVSCLEDSD